MYGCRYCKMNMTKREEYCTLTKKPTNGAVMCDFEWEDCAEYKAAQEPIKLPKAHGNAAGQADSDKRVRCARRKAVQRLRV